MSALEIIGVVALVVWIPFGILLTTLLAFEKLVSPATFFAFLSWYRKERHNDGRRNGD